MYLFTLMLCVALQTNRKNANLITLSDRLSFIHKIITKQDQYRAQSMQSSDMCIVDVHHISHDIGSHVSCGNLFSANMES